MSRKPRLPEFTEEPEMRHDRRVPVIAAALAAIVLSGWLSQPPADATSDDATSDGEAAGPVAAPAANAHGTVADVTLLTGHVLRVMLAPDGKQSAIVMETPDGSDGNVIAVTDGQGDLHVVPREALPYLQDGLLDERLFNVTALVAQGYADDQRDSIPLIVSYPSPSTDAQVRAESGSLRSAGAADIQSFTSADVMAMTVDKENTADFWGSVAGDVTARSATPDLLGGATKIWLDGTVEASLDESVPLVGAPQAWADGYDGSGATVAVLDTGYDPAHPDLADLVTDESGFDGTGSAIDGNGHGTHVAATVAGSGAASDGARRGVAPGAELLVGKVLDDSGLGKESWVLAGMEWAAQSGADVVNMSLGGGPTDGTDPLSQAVDSLTESTGTLFVVAAGNLGPSAGTVATPGAASAALTVGNTDKSDQLHDGSSRGPRLGDHAVKPEITAPGTDIVAARAAGTSLGFPVDQHYTSVTGTSMATPHVAGAAAILAQRHPDWTAAQVKSALVGYAHPLADRTVFEQGAGRLDVPAALDATVTAEQSTLSFGYKPWPGAGSEPIKRTVTYRNTGDTSVQLELTASADHSGGGELPGGAFTVAPANVVVPAGGTASAVVTVMPELIEPGDVSGMLLASADGATIRTPWSYGEETEHYTLTVDAVDRDGGPSTGWAMVWSERMGMYYYGVYLDGSGPKTLRLPRDDYMVIGGSTVYDADGHIVDETIGGVPELVLSEDRSVTFDAREGDELVFRTPRPSTPASVQLGWTRRYDNGSGIDGRAYYNDDVPRLAIAPSEAVREGQFEFFAGGRLVAPDTPVERTPYLYDLLLPTSGRLPATGTYEVDEADLARVDTTFVGVGENGRTTRESRDGFAGLGFIRVGGANAVHEASRVDYVSGNGVRWQSMVALPHASEENVPTMWDNTHTYPAGERLSTRWWGAPYSVGTDSDYSVTDAYRNGNDLSVLLRDYQDDEPDHWGDSYLYDDELATVRSRFYIGDTLLYDQKRGKFTLEDLPAEPATYRLVHSVTRRGPTWTSSSYSESDWTFRSGFESDTSWPPKGIPLLDVNWSIPTDAQNRAPDRSRFTLEIHARHVRGLDGGAIGRARGWVSYDDGEHWRRMPLVPRRGDRYTAILVHPPKERTSGWVSLRVEVEDSSGGSLRQTAIRAYALK